MLESLEIACRDGIWSAAISRRASFFLCEFVKCKTEPMTKLNKDSGIFCPNNPYLEKKGSNNCEGEDIRYIPFAEIERGRRGWWG